MSTLTLPFPKQEKQFTVLSYGIGQDSTAILLKCLHDSNFRQQYVHGELIVVTADTKNEHAKTQLYLEYIKNLCHKNEIRFYHLNPKIYATGAWKDGLIGFYEKHNAIGSKAFPKTCTDNLKIRPIYKFLEMFIHIEFNTKSYGKKKAFYEYYHQYGKIDVLLGIAKGEEKRASENGSTGIKWFDKCINKVYPLIDLEMNRKSCQDYIQKLGYQVPFPSNCILCPFMSQQELLYLFKYNNKWYNKFVELEAAKIKKNSLKTKKNLGVWGTKELLPQILEQAIKKYGHMTKRELEEYKFSHGHCVTSKY